MVKTRSRSSTLSKRDASDLTKAEYITLVNTLSKNNDLQALRQLAKQMGVNGWQTATSKQLRARLLRSKVVAYVGYAAFHTYLNPLGWYSALLGAAFGTSRKYALNQRTGRRYVHELQ